MHESLRPYLDRVDTGHLSMVTDEDLVLFNYSDKTTFERAWDEYTLQARGIIFEKATGKIVARPFGKFFNYEELAREKIPAVDLSQPHYLQEKMDGSLGIIFYWKGDWRVATRGSFTSTQAFRGKQILNRYRLNGCFTPGNTYLVEIIYPENKIIVPYGDQEKLVLLAVRHTETGEYESHDVLFAIGTWTKMDVAPKVDMPIYDALQKKKSIPHTEEGWVVVFDDGSRVKIKGDNYLRIARFMADLSPLSVWEALMEDAYNDLLQGCPDECMDELVQVHDRLWSDWVRLSAAARAVKDTISIEGRDRKSIAQDIMVHPKWMRDWLFAQIADWNREEPAKKLLKLIRPTGNQFISLDQFLEGT